MKSGEFIAGKYVLKNRLGVGGMGEVWSAEHTGTGRDFAIKFMHAHVATNEAARQRFAREARASARINHPNIIDVFDVGELDGGVLYLVMELLDGLSLADAFFVEPPLSVRDFIAAALETARALAAAHAAGIVHRDIKPGNIFLHKNRSTGLASARLLDFGISKFSANEDSFATKTGSVLGSPRYMSPEQARSAAAADHRADLWAMGVILFEGLTGMWPHEGDSFSSLVVAIATTPPLSIDRIAPHLPDDLRSVVRDCLQPLEQRLASSAELAARLEAIWQNEILGAAPLPRPLRGPGDGRSFTTGGGLKMATPPPSQSFAHDPRRGAPAQPPAVFPTAMLPSNQAVAVGAHPQHMAFLETARSPFGGPPLGPAGPPSAGAQTMVLPMQGAPVLGVLPATPATMPMPFGTATPGPAGAATSGPPSDPRTAPPRAPNDPLSASVSSLVTVSPTGPQGALASPSAALPQQRGLVTRMGGPLGVAAALLGVAAVGIGIALVTVLRSPGPASGGPPTEAATAATNDLPTPQPPATAPSAAIDPAPAEPAPTAAPSASAAPSAAPAAPRPVAAAKPKPEPKATAKPTTPPTKPGKVEQLGSGL